MPKLSILVTLVLGMRYEILVGPFVKGITREGWKLCIFTSVPMSTRCRVRSDEKNESWWEKINKLQDKISFCDDYDIMMGDLCSDWMMTRLSQWLTNNMISGVHILPEFFLISAENVLLYFFYILVTCISLILAVYYDIKIIIYIITQIILIIYIFHFIC